MLHRIWKYIGIDRVSNERLLYDPGGQNWDQASSRCSQSKIFKADTEGVNAPYDMDISMSPWTLIKGFLDFNIISDFADYFG